MVKVTLAQLGGMLRKQRGDRGIREVAGEIGVSPATLSRVERGNVPDLATFGKICRWLKVNPAEVLGIEGFKSTAGAERGGPLVATAHFRAGRTTSPELAKALAEMILAAEKMMGGQSS